MTATQLITGPCRLGLVVEDVFIQDSDCMQAAGSEGMDSLLQYTDWGEGTLLRPPSCSSYLFICSLALQGLAKVSFLACLHGTRSTCQILHFLLGMQPECSVVEFLFKNILVNQTQYVFSSR